MAPRRRKDPGVATWDDWDPSADYDNAPDLMFSISADGSRLNCRPEFVPPAPKKRKICDLDAPHRTWNPMEADEDDDPFAFPEHMEDWGAPNVQLCDEQPRKRTSRVRSI